ncbi:bifunctional phosphoribosylaminoimidazolecarboxamide formyltransferase/IMP cyclohydrolase [bacterium]|nr:bifunctional phosphoribosylaminoimidazolecarboxamide formyltransferase/IMP cyclohydrolase [bacterium]
MKRRAFISVYDKVGLVDFAKNLVDKFDYEIVSCGNTYEVLVNAGIEVINVSEFSNFAGLLKQDYEVFNETFLASVLANSNDLGELTAKEKAIIKPFDMVVVNLCPFEVIESKNSNPDDIIKDIDIVGITLLRAAAKNYKNVTVITDKVDYYVALNANEFGRLKLAAKAFNVTANYDRLICGNLAEHTGEKPFKIFNFEKMKDLAYGENPHQKSSIYKTDKMADYEILNEAELSFNNIIDITTAVNVVSEFYDVNCVTIIRHGKPCGVALGRSLYEAYTKAFDCDPISSFYGVVGFSKKVDTEVAKHLNSMSVEVVIAPGFDDNALEIFKDNSEIKLLKLNTSLKEYRRLTMEEVIMTPFGVLVQDRNNSELDKDMFKVVTREKPTPEQIEDAIFAWKVVKYAKTNSAVVARDFKTSAIAQGHTNVLPAIEWALNYACDNSKEAVLATDSAIQSEDSIYSAVQARINLIIQPGGSVKDQQLIDVCNKYGIAMITTGIRNYKQ